MHFLKGLTAEQMALSRKTKPTMEWTKDGDTYKTMVTAPGMPERHQTFKLDVEFEEVAIGNRKVKVQTAVHFKVIIRFSFLL